MKSPPKSPLRKARHRLARQLAPDIVWNSDMSREIDRLTIKTEDQQDKIKQLEKELEMLRIFGDLREGQQ